MKTRRTEVVITGKKQKGTARFEPKVEWLFDGEKWIDLMRVEK
jgi:hypothetical protein